MKVKYLVFGSLVVFLATTLLAYKNAMSSWLLPIAEKYISPDNNISEFGQSLFSKTYNISCFMLLTLGLLILIASSDNIRNKIDRVFLKDDDLNCGRTRNVINLALSFFLGILLSAAYKISKLHTVVSKSSLYQEDGFFENLTALIFVISAILLLRAMWNINKKSLASFNASGRFRMVKTVFALIAGGFFFIAMEEISWGQRFFGWETPEYLTNVNLQNESNLHNIVYNYFDILYPIAASLLLIIALAAVGQRLKRRHSFFLSILLPHPSTLFIVLLIALFCVPPFGREGELIEELACLYGLLYSLRALLLSKRINLHEAGETGEAFA